MDNQYNVKNNSYQLHKNYLQLLGSCLFKYYSQQLTGHLIKGKTDIKNPRLQFVYQKSQIIETLDMDKDQSAAS